MPVKKKKKLQSSNNDNEIVNLVVVGEENKKRGRPKKKIEIVEKKLDRIEALREIVHANEDEFWNKNEDIPKENIKDDELEQKKKELEDVEDTLKEISEIFKKEYTAFTAHAILNSLWFDPEGKEAMENEISKLLLAKEDLLEEIIRIKKAE